MAWYLVKPRDNFTFTLWHQKIHYHMHKNTSEDCIRNQLNAVHVLILCLFKIHLNIIFPSKPRSLKWPFPFGSYH
jgi:hypothetical protein